MPGALLHTPLERMIQVENVRKEFGDFTAVGGVSFSVDRTSGITALLGPNGAGKSTTMRLMTGYLTPTSGEIHVNGLSVMDPGNRVEVKRQVGYLPESSPLYPEMLVSEYLEFIGNVRGLTGSRLEERAREMVDRLELASHFYSPIGILSKGYRQRVALAGTLIHDPDIIILDEPTSGLDPNQISHIRSLILDLGREKTLILSTHILQEVEEICQRVIIMSRGRIVADESTDALRSSHGCTIVARGDRARERLLAIPLVKSCSEGQPVSPQGFVRYSCELKEDRPESLFASLAKEPLEVREFSPLAHSLQEIFQELTGGDPDAPGRPDSSAR